MFEESQGVSGPTQASSAKDGSPLGVVVRDVRPFVPFFIPLAIQLPERSDGRSGHSELVPCAREHIKLVRRSDGWRSWNPLTPTFGLLRALFFILFVSVAGGHRPRTAWKSKNIFLSTVYFSLDASTFFSILLHF